MLTPHLNPLPVRIIQKYNPTLFTIQGHDIQSHILSCFGGAGGQHACAIARSLGVPQVFIHKYSSILSAVGMGVADVVNEKQNPFNGVLGVDESRALGDLIKLEERAVAELDVQVNLCNVKAFEGHTYAEFSVVLPWSICLYGIDAYLPGKLGVSLMKNSWTGPSTEDTLYSVFQKKE